MSDLYPKYHGSVFFSSFYHAHPRIDITNVYEKSARSAKEGPVVGWGLRRRKRGGGRRRRRTRGEICAAPFYAAILTS